MVLHDVPALQGHLMAEDGAQRLCQHLQAPPKGRHSIAQSLMWFFFLPVKPRSCLWVSKCLLTLQCSSWAVFSVQGRPSNSCRTWTKYLVLSVLMAVWFDKALLDWEPSPGLPLSQWDHRLPEAMVLWELRHLIVLCAHGLGFIGLQGYHANRNWNKAARSNSRSSGQQWRQKASSGPPLISVNPFISGVSLPAASAPRWTCSTIHHLSRPGGDKDIHCEN